MKSPHEVCLITIARLNSQRCPSKMVRPFAGSSLLDICFSKLSASISVPPSNKYASLYDQPLLEIASNYPINIHRRSYNSANTESSLPIMYEFHRDLPFKYVVLVNPCNPLLSVSTIDDFVRSFLESDQESLFGVHETRNFYWDSLKNPITPWPANTKVLNTKLLPVTYAASHALYAGRMDTIANNIWMADPPWTVDSPKLYIMPNEEVFDIDYEWEFEIGQLIYNSRFRNSSA